MGMLSKYVIIAYLKPSASSFKLFVLNDKLIFTQAISKLVSTKTTRVKIKLMVEMAMQELFLLTRAMMSL